jgi:hypothetical protein
VHIAWWARIQFAVHQAGAGDVSEDQGCELEKVCRG